MNIETDLTELQKSLQSSLESIKSYCTENRQTIAVAESVTSGFIQLLLSTAEKAQDYFQGGITVYNCSQKAIHLGIEPIFAAECNGVDIGIANDMARNVCNMFRCQIGIGITGYATRVPEEGIDEIYAFVTIVRNGEILYSGKLTSEAEGIAAQCDYASQVVNMLAKRLNN